MRKKASPNRAERSHLYYSKISFKSNEYRIDILDVKEKSFLQIRNIQEFIKNYNKRTKDLSNNKNTIESILIQNDIELNNRKKKKLKKLVF